MIHPSQKNVGTDTPGETCMSRTECDGLHPHGSISITTLKESPNVVVLPQRAPEIDVDNGREHTTAKDVLPHGVDLSAPYVHDGFAPYKTKHPSLAFSTRMVFVSMKFMVCR